MSEDIFKRVIYFKLFANVALTNVGLLFARDGIAANFAVLN
jgi:hypothetical protein